MTKPICDWCDEPISGAWVESPCGEQLHQGCIDDHASNCMRYDCATLYGKHYTEATKTVLPCEHDSDEDCMHCINCGSGCREDLDDDDYCPDCTVWWEIKLQVQSDDIDAFIACLRKLIREGDHVLDGTIASYDVMDT